MTGSALSSLRRFYLVVTPLLLAVYILNLALLVLDQELISDYSIPYLIFSLLACFLALGARVKADELGEPDRRLERFHPFLLIAFLSTICYLVLFHSEIDQHIRGILPPMFLYTSGYGLDYSFGALMRIKRMRSEE